MGFARWAKGRTPRGTELALTRTDWPWLCVSLWENPQESIDGVLPPQASQEAELLCSLGRDGLGISKAGAEWW